VPTGGAAARLLTETGSGTVVDPEDVEAIRRALIAMRDRTNETDFGLSPEWRTKLARRTRVEEFAQLLRSLVEPDALR
jgi:hypothetical protein